MAKTWINGNVDISNLSKPKHAVIKVQSDFLFDKFHYFILIGNLV